jgi:hypothetical protein
MNGWIVNLWDPWLSAPQTRQEMRMQPPLFYLDEDPVFEVWFWHSELNRWFVMSASYNATLQSQGVVYFCTIDDLLHAVELLGGNIPDAVLARRQDWPSA